MTDSYKEVATYNGIEVDQPGLELAPNQNPPNIVEPESKPVPRNQYICGLRKLTFWLTAVAAVVVIALAVGLGVGLTVPSASSEPATTSVDTPTSSPQATSTTSTSTSTSTSSTASSSSTPSTSSSSTASPTITGPTPSPTSTISFDRSGRYTCPGANNTEIQDVGGSASYYIFCDTDIHAREKKDLSSSVQSSFADCLALCNSMNSFQEREDVGCTYNFEGTGGQDVGTCWCLGGEDKFFVTNEGNMAAVLASENPVLQL